MGVNEPAPLSGGPAPAGSRAGRGQGQALRRLLYGGNAAVSIAAAVGLALLVVWFAGFVIERSPAPVASALQLDLTENRRFSLSPRTLGVVDALEEPAEVIRIAADAEDADFFERLDRARGGDSLLLTAISPVRSPDEWAAFQRRIHRITGGEEVVAATRAAVETGSTVAAAYLEAAKLLSGAADALSVEEESAAEKLRSDAATFAAQATTLERTLEPAGPALDRPLPEITPLRSSLLELLRALREQQVPTMQRYLQARAADRRAPAGARDAALRAGTLLNVAVAPLGAASGRLTDAVVPRDHDRAAATLATGRGVVVIQGTAVRTIAWPEDTPSRVLEERLAAALLTLGLPDPPVLVWVDSADAPALGQGGSFNAAAARARDAGFEIARLPLGPGPLAQPSFASERPVVWVVPPVATPDSSDEGPVNRLAALLKTRLEAGDGVLWIPGYRRLGRFATVDPMASVGQAAGITVREGELVLRLRAGAAEAGEAEASSRFEIPFGVSESRPGLTTGSGAGEAGADRAADAAARLRAAMGTGIAFLQLPQPLEMQSRAAPLLTLAEPEQWVEPEPLATGSLGDARPDSGEAREPQAVAALGLTGEAANAGRVAVFGDSLLFRDAVLQQGRRSANADLFAATCLWLAGLDQAVVAAPSAGVGQVLPALEGDTRRGLQVALVGGLPVAIGLLGLIVAWLRRG